MTSMDLFSATTVYVTIMSVLFPAVYCGLTDNCPSEFTLSSDPPRKVLLRVKQNDSYCLSVLNRTANIRQRRGDLDLTLGLPIIKFGEYYLNISWSVMVNRNNQFPKKYGIFLLYFEQNIIERTCLTLKLEDRTAAPLQNSLTLTLDCIKLFNDTKEGVLHMVVWKGSGECDRPRRTRRHSGCDMIEKSDISRYELSLDHYKHQICSCHYSCATSKPRLHVETIEDGETIDFEISLTNLPDYLRYAVITVTANGKEKRSYSFEQPHMFQNRTIKFITNNMPRVQGTYNLLLFYECIQKRVHDVPTSSACHPSDTFNFTLTQVKDNPQQNRAGKIGTIFIVCGGIVSVCFAVVVLMYSYPPYIVCRMIKRSANAVLTNNNTERNYDIARNSFEVPIAENESLLQFSDKPLSAILLSHAADMEPVHVSIRENLLKNKVQLIDGRDVNWKESAFDLFTSGREFYDVIIFVSVGLLELLYGAEKTKKTRLEERLYENVPDIILSRLKTLDDTTRRRCAIHILSTKSDEGEKLVHNFKSKFKSIDRFVSHSYYFQTSAILISENQPEFRQLLCNLHYHQHFEK